MTSRPDYNDKFSGRQSQYTYKTTSGLVYVDKKWESVFNGLNVKHGGDNPDYQDDIQRLQDASNPYTRSGYFRFTHPRYKCNVLSGTQRSIIDGCGTKFPTYTSPNDATLRDIALGRLKNKLASDANDFKILAPLAELRDLGRTFDSMVNITSWFARNALGFKHRLIQRAGGSYLRRSDYQVLGDAWLTWSFGMRPLASDYMHTLDAIEGFLKRKNHMKRARGTASKSWTEVVYSGGQVQYSSIVTVQNRARLTHKLGYRFNAGTAYEIASGNNYGVADHFHFHPGDIMPALWELMPWSWLIDYFSTAGAYIDDVFSSKVGRVVYVVESKRYSVKATTDLVNPVPVTGYVESFSTTEGGFDYGYFNRTPLATMPTRSLRLKTSEEIAKNGLNKLLNLLSILATRGGPRIRR